MGIAVQGAVTRIDVLVRIMKELPKQNHALCRESQELMNWMEHLLCKAIKLSCLTYQAVW